MQYRDAFKARAKPRAALAAYPERQRDFGNENDRGFTARQGILHGAHVNFRFAAARHPMEQQHTEFAKLESRANQFQGALLLGIQFMGGGNVSDVEWILRRIDALIPAFEQGVAQHSLNHAT